MTLIEIIIKCSLWVTVTWLFYRAVLYQITFYNWNRYYLLVYSLLAFVVPFFDVSPWLHNQQLPVLPVNHLSGFTASIIKTGDSGMGAAWWFLIILLCGAAVAGLRLLVQFVSFSRVKKRSTLIFHDGGVRVFNSEELKGPFSFGNDIYINANAHSGDELKRILMHEIVHIRQKHTIDLIVSELLCIFNWYNPFAWLLRKSIKQNLEFIADSNVLSNGVDKKEYQYLLLKVTGINRYQIATHFSMSNLKKRIIMINKLKSAKVHLTKFLFALPLLAVMLLAFRSPHDTARSPVVIAEADTLPTPEYPDVVEENVVPDQMEKYNSKGYNLSVISTKGEDYVVIKSRDDKTPSLMPLADWFKNKRENQRKYGKLPQPAPPAPPAPPAAPAAPAVSPEAASAPPPIIPAAPAAPATPVVPAAPKAPRKSGETK